MKSARLRPAQVLLGLLVASTLPVLTELGFRGWNAWSYQEWMQSSNHLAAGSEWHSLAPLPAAAMLMLDFLALLMALGGVPLVVVLSLTATWRQRRRAWPAWVILYTSILAYYAVLVFPIESANAPSALDPSAAFYFTKFGLALALIGICGGSVRWLGRFALEAQVAGTPPPGWYFDPAGSPELRWWDGNAWTQHSAQV